MSLTTKYKFEDLSTKTTEGWNGVISSNNQKLDYHINTYYPIVCGEEIEKHAAVHIGRDGLAYNAQANGVKQPSIGCAVTYGDVSWAIVVKRCGKLRSASFSFGTIGGRVYLSDSVAGGVTQVKPATDVQILGIASDSNELHLDVFYDVLGSTKPTVTSTTSSTSSSTSSSSSSSSTNSTTTTTTRT